jgi:uncharacterized membrane protein
MRTKQVKPTTQTLRNFIGGALTVIGTLLVIGTGVAFFLVQAHTQDLGSIYVYYDMAPTFILGLVAIFGGTILLRQLRNYLGGALMVIGTLLVIWTGVTFVLVQASRDLDSIYVSYDMALTFIIGLVAIFGGTILLRQSKKRNQP